MNFLKSIADKAKSVTDSPLRQPGPPIQDEGDVSGQAEGFLCPSCMAGFPSPELLQQHYEDQHIIDQDITETTQQPTERYGRLTLSGDVNGDVLKSTTPETDDEEKSMYYEQLRALEESKHLLSSEVITLRKQLSESQDHSNSKIVDKASELAAENVGLKAALDDITSQKAAAEERISLLEATNAHRNTLDDAAVLRQELVTVQKMMDEYAKEKEKELKEAEEKNVQLTQLLQNQSDDMVNSDVLTAITIRNEELEANVEKLQTDLLATSKNLENAKASCQSNLKDFEAKANEVTESAKMYEKQLLTISDLECKFNEQLHLTETLKRDLEISRKEECKTASMLEEATTELEDTQVKLQKEAATVDQLRAKVGDFERKIEDTDRSLSKLTSEYEALSKKLADRETDITRLSGEREELLGQIEAGEGVNIAIQQLTAENTDLQEKLSRVTNTCVSKEKELGAIIDEVRNELGKSKADHNATADRALRLEQELLESGSKLDKLQLKYGNLEEEMRTKETVASTKYAETTATIDGLKSQIVTGEEMLKNVTNDLEKTKSAGEKTSGALKEAEKDVELLSSHLAEKNAELEQLHTEKTKLANELQEQTNHHKKLKTDLKISSQRIVTLENTVQTLNDEARAITENNDVLKNANTTLQQEKLKLEQELDTRSSMCTELGTKLSGKESRLSDMQSVISATEQKVDEMRKAIEAAKGKEEVLLSTIEENKKIITNIEEEKTNAVTNLESNQTSLKALINEKIGLEKSLMESKLEKQQMEEMICSLQGGWEKEREADREEMEQLRAARELLLGQVVELRTRQEEIAAEANTEKAKLKKDLDKNLEKVRETTEKLSIVQTELSTKEAEKKEMDHKIIRLESDFKSQLSDKVRMLTEVEKESEKLKRELSDVEADRDAALSRSLEAEAVLGATTEERKALLERCLAAEGEMERGRNTNIELRRKLDDAQAAVHELGRENQSLQVELMKQAGRKWKDDSEVMECANCSVGFSITNRKHHCRNCGEIFCTNCSSKQTSMAGYKKPQRVCDACFTELASK